MKHDIIKTNNYLLVVDGSEIKNGDWMHRNNEQPTFVTPNFWWDFKDKYRKIIAHRPFNNAPTLEGVDLLPPLKQEDDVEQLSDINATKYKRDDDIDDLILGVSQNSFVEGYNIAREKYDSLIIKTLNEFDLEIKKHLLMYSIEHSIHGKMCDGINEIRSNIIKSLSQRKMPIAFECDTEITHIGNGTYSMDDMDLPLTNLNPIKVIKTITSSQGQTQWVGKYIYA